MSYEDMSDLQINLLVANAIGVDAAENSGVVFGAVKHEGENVVSVIGVVDYCNNPSDAWPIITSNSIAMFEAVLAGGDEIWVATTNIDKSWLGYGTGGFDSYHKNPLRAAMIVFLMMQEKAQ